MRYSRVNTRKLHSRATDILTCLFLCGVGPNIGQTVRWACNLLCQDSRLNTAHNIHVVPSFGLCHDIALKWHDEVPTLVTGMWLSFFSGPTWTFGWMLAIACSVVGHDGAVSGFIV